MCLNFETNACKYSQKKHVENLNLNNIDKNNIKLILVAALAS